MQLMFPELMGGPVQGLNDAGVENFQGAIDLYVSRECGQNTGDAVRGDMKTAKLEFDRLVMKAGDIPGFESLRTTLDSCLERWGTKEKEKEFFEKAVEIASQDDIPVLRISDYGTTGLTGDDTDETGRWFALVKSQGVSNKENTAGGSFGIGKSSPFAASRFRTVFYGSRTGAGSVALQGVSRLVTHWNANGRETQGVGFIGAYDADGGAGGGPVFRAIRKPTEIPEPFRRTEAGTDIWVIGYRSGPEWSTDLIRSILTNFWPAIHRGSIEFRVGPQVITRANLGELIQQYVGNEEFQAHQFYKAIASEPIRKRLKTVGQCELYLTTSSPDLPKQICMARNSGMRIFDYSPRACRVPFSGLFICNDDDGNKLLRKLEPPKHDAWDPKRTEDESGKRALDEIKGWIRDEVKKLNPLFGGKSFNETELAKYLPDTPPDDTSELPHDSTGASEEESLEPRPRAQDLVAPPVKAKQVQKLAGGTAEGGFGIDGEAGGGEHGDGHKGDGSNRGGGSAEDETPPTVNVRSFGSGTNRYELVLRSPTTFNGKMRLQAVGEDGTTESVALTGAVFAGAALGVRGDTIEGIQIKAGVPLRLSVTLDAPTRRSLTGRAIR